ncbi:MAG: aspartate kinase [Tannerella sp.]|jgi:aspartate kinase|nr:aspartate kinase [Tannerella sp.]
MKVLKFGGTSVGTAARIRSVAELINNGDRKFVVLSAMSGTTNSLLEIADYIYCKNHDAANEAINRLSDKYSAVIDELYETAEYKDQARLHLNRIFNQIRSLVIDLFTLFEERVIVSQGEMMSVGLMYLYLLEKNVKTVVIPALDYMRIDKNAEPDNVFIKDNLNALLSQHPDIQIYLTQGFVCRNAYGEIDNLQRGGSDYTASLVGAAINAEEIQIWTDIDGMHNNDPRVVKNTTPVRHLNFDEAAELAYFGAKILHPTCILPAKVNNIPVRLLNTMQPDAPGTTISNDMERAKIKAVAAKDNITVIKVKSGRMLLATGFMRKVFEIFETYHTPIDMVTTSEVGISVTVDNRKNLDDIVATLKKYGTVTIDSEMVIICVVGDFEWENVGFEAKIVDALKDIPVRMISYGGSNYNVSILVKAADKKRALQELSNHLFRS